MKLSRLSAEPLEDRTVPAFPVAVDDTFDVPPLQLTNLDVIANDAFPQQSKVTGFSPIAAELGTLALSGNGLTFFATDAFQGGTFTYTSGALTPDTTLVGAAPRQGDALGGRSAVSADGNWLALSARTATIGNLQGVGYVTVYERVGAGWALRQSLLPSDVSNGGVVFGESLAFDATGSTLIVGAPQADLADSPNCGAAFVFTRTGSLFGEAQLLRAAEPQINGGFGLFVTLSTDGNTLAVGESGADTNRGRVTVYTRELNVYRPRQVLTASDRAGGDLFGAAALSGDGQTIVVGAPGADVGGLVDAGKAYLFARVGDTFDERAILRAPDPVNGARFADNTLSVSANGSTIAIASRIPQTVYVFNRAGNDPGTPQVVPLTDTGDPQFPVSPILTGDGNTLFVGQPGATVNDLQRAGRVVRFGRVDGAFVQQEVIAASDPVAGEQLGGAPSVTPDGNTLVTGAILATNNGVIAAGEGHVFERGTSTATVTLRRGASVVTPQFAQLGQRLLMVTGQSNGIAQSYRYATDGAANLEATDAFPGFNGVVQSTAGDINGDGVADRIFATGPGGSLLRVVNGADGTELVPAFATFEGSFTGGIFVSALDIDQDGKAEIAVSPDVGGGGRVQIFAFDGTALVIRDNFFGIDDLTFRGGARVALGDIDGDGRAELIVGAGFGGGPRIAIFDGEGLLQGQSAPPKLVGDFFAFPGSDAKSLRNGVFVSAGDLDGDGKADLVFGGGPGGGPRVYILRGPEVVANVEAAQANPIANFFVGGDTSSRGGVRVAVKDANGDSRLDLIVGSGQGRPANVRTYLGGDLTPSAEPPSFNEFAPFDGVTVAGGVFVG